MVGPTGGDVARVLDLAHGKRDVESVAAELGVPMSAVRWWGDEALGQRHRGRTPVSNRDIARLRFVMFEETGIAPVAARGWKRREAERILDIQWRALEGRTTTPEEMRWLKGRKFNGRPVADDMDKLRELGRRRLVDPGEWYREWQS